MARAYLPVGSPYLMFNWCNRRAEKKAGGLPPDEVIHLNWNISSQRWDGPANFIPPFICCLSVARPSEPLAFFGWFHRRRPNRHEISSGWIFTRTNQIRPRFNLQQPVLRETKPLWWSGLHIHTRFTCMVDYDSAGERTLPFFSVY